MKLRALGLVCLALALAAPLAAQAAAQPAAQPASQLAAQPATGPGAATSAASQAPATGSEVPPAAPGSAPSAVAPPAPTAPVPVPEPSEKAMRYYRGGVALWLVDLLWGLIVPAAIAFSGLSARLRDRARKIGRWWLPTIAVYFVFFSLILFFVDLPLDFYAGFVREHAYGLSNQTLGKWAGDAVKGLAVGLVGGCLFLWVPFGILCKSPRRWWLWVGLAAVPFLFFVTIVAPVWIDPLFNRFGPMKDAHLAADIRVEAGRAGIGDADLFEVDKSADTKTLNAYVTGFLGSKRIVVWDTLVARLDEREVLFVLGHEMGHYVLGHVVEGVLAASGLLLLGLWGTDRLSRPLLRRFAGQLGFDRLSDVAALPLLLVLLQAVGLVLMPFGLALSRHMEHEADRFGLELTHDNHAAATAFVALQTDNLSNPRPGRLVELMRGSHPSLAERIDFANTYHPWAEGRPGRYASLIHDE